MNPYRYVVFPPGVVPLSGEVAKFRRYTDLLDRHVAYGKRRSDGGLAIACDAEPFDRLRGLDPAFEELLLKWQVRGGEIVEKLPFTKDPDPWKKIDEHQATPTEEKRKSNSPKPINHGVSELQSKQAIAKEAEAKSHLAIDRTAHRGKEYERLAGWLPYAFWTIAGVSLLAFGGYIGFQLLNKEGERRTETIERIAIDPMKELLTPIRPVGDPQPSDASITTPSKPSARPPRVPAREP